MSRTASMPPDAPHQPTADCAGLAPAEARVQVGRTIAVVAGMYPLRSETFVYGEVEAMRARGWQVRTVSLHEPAEPAEQALGRPEPTAVPVYGRHARRTFAHAAGELLTRPMRGLGTLALALRDAVCPGEPTSLRDRLKLPAQAFFAFGLARRLRGEDVQFLHAHFAHAPTTLAMYAARQLGVPFSFVGHANDIFQRRALLRRKLERAAFVSCISRWHRDFYIGVHRRDDTGYPIIRCGVDVGRWQPRERSVRHAGRTVLTVCRLVEKKGVDTLIEAVGELNRQSSPAAPQSWRLIVAGDGPERSTLEALAQRANCADAIVWEGSVSSERVRELMADADVFALPCRADRMGDRDGIPVVLMEAMACAIPVVAGDLPAIRELVEHEDTGLLVAGGEVSALVTALDRLDRQPDFAGALGAAGRGRVLSEFSRKTAADRLEQAIEAAITGKEWAR